MTCTNLPLPDLLKLDLSTTLGYYFGFFIKQDFQSCQNTSMWFHKGKESPVCQWGYRRFEFKHYFDKKSVQSKTLPHFRNKELPCISYSYTRSVASNIFNYKRSLQQIDFPIFFSKSLTFYLTWLRVSVCTISSCSDRKAQYHMKCNTERSFAQRSDIQETCLIFMAPELWH